MYSKLPVIERFYDKVMPEPNTGCWLWTGSLASRGYGKICKDGKEIYAHQFAYNLLVGPIPEGLELDHKCRVTSCVNPHHLEPVTHRENVRRGKAMINGYWHTKKTHCPKGHEYTKENTRIKRVKGRASGNRVCKECERQFEKSYSQKRILLYRLRREKDRYSATKVS